MEHQDTIFEAAMKLEELLNKMECAVLGIESDEAETAKTTAEYGILPQNAEEQKSFLENGDEK